MADVTITEIENILKTLPISFYIKQKVDVKLDNNSTNSYFDTMTRKIVISSKTIIDTLSKISTNNLTLEESIRCLLYHETSHAFLTPKKLKMTNIINIFEDERIESLLRYHYMKVDFRNFVKVVNNYNKNTIASSARQLFYQIVRFRMGPDEFVNQVHCIILKYKKLNQESDIYSCKHYENDIDKLWNKVQEYFKKYYNNSQEQEINNTNNSFNTLSNIKNKSTDESQESIVNTSNINTNIINNISNIYQNNDNMSNICDSQQLEEYNAKLINSTLSNIINMYYSPTIDSAINEILASTKRINKNNSSAINSYSGRFDPRSVVRDDYKYFVQQNRSGHVKQFSKLHLNLFIDCSGSFYENDIAVNKLLYSLVKFEKSNSEFSFDLISCGKGERVRNKDDRIQYSDGGTYLDKEIYNIFKKQQFSECNNVNLVLFDGYAFEHAPRNSDKDVYKSFKAFDTMNTIIISDYENYDVIIHNVHSAKYIFTRDYYNELEKNVLKSLRVLCH